MKEQRYYPLRPMGTSPTLREEFDKNSPPGLGGVAKAEGVWLGIQN